MKKQNFNRAYHTITVVKNNGTFRLFVSFLHENRLIVLTFIVIAILVDSLITPLSTDIAYFGILACYILFYRFYHMRSSLTFMLCLGIIVAILISLILSQASIRTEKLTVWFFLLMVVGILQQWNE